MFSSIEDAGESLAGKDSAEEGVDGNSFFQEKSLFSSVCSFSSKTLSSPWDGARLVNPRGGGGGIVNFWAVCCDIVSSLIEVAGMLRDGGGGGGGGGGRFCDSPVGLWSCCMPPGGGSTFVWGVVRVVTETLGGSGGRIVAEPR